MNDLARRLRAIAAARLEETFAAVQRLERMQAQLALDLSVAKLALQAATESHERIVNETYEVADAE